MKTLPRTEYLNQLLKFLDKKLIKVISGVRRCGKSTLLQLLQEHLRRSGVTEEQIVAVNFEDFDAEPLCEARALHTFLREKLVPGRMTYIFLDEIQHVEDFPRVVDSLSIRDNVDIYITGSNGRLLSADIAALLTGRYVEIRMLPLSFREFVEATAEKEPLRESYLRYLEQSSFPYALELGSDKAVRTYLEGILDGILMKDIVERYKISEPSLLRSITAFLFDSIGSEVSSRGIANALSSTRRKTDPKTVDRYLSALVASQLFYEAKRYDIRGKRLLTRLEKYYSVDPALRRLMLARSGMDVGHVLENVVYLELLRRGYDVSVGKQDDYEVDFVARSHAATLYVQVSATVRDAGTLARELRSLEAVRDNNPKLLLTLDDDPPMSYEGIWRMNALEWLVGRMPDGTVLQ